MTAQTPAAAPIENVGRGAAASVLAIPAAIILFAIAGSIFEFWGVAAFLVPPIAAWLYAKGAGTPLTRRGWGAFIGINVVAIALGILAGIVGQAWAAFSSVGGNGGPFGAPFLHQVGNRFTSPDTVLPLIIAIAVGAVAIVGVIRGPQNRATPAAAPGTLPPATPAATTAPSAPPAAPAPPVAPNLPSPGVILNGKPVDPDPTKK